MEDTELLKKYNDIYLEIIMRYKEHIEEKESLYVAELPKLITPGEDGVANAAKGITDSFPLYRYEESFPEASSKAYDYIKERITPIALPIQFWQRPSDTLKHEAGDVFDRAVLLCSLLIALGAASSKVIIRIRDNDRIFLVYTEYNGRIIAIDMEKGMKEYGSRDALLESLGIVKGADVTAYEFNDKTYSDIA
ncbi:MAG: hypothetical protein KGH69_05115 [Candidatus Micrarchaeota archaeon]|nr:hypothetical protein [Candidatus Micrarchaeota archaeon]